VLAVRGLEVSYGAVRAVQGIDLDVGWGEVVALLGPNGAGKTSTLRAITALTPYRGSITFDGDEVSKLGTEACARRGLIHVPEGRHVFPTLTVHENLQVGTTAARGRKADYGIDEVYDLFPALANLRDRAGWALSGGEQQMVAVGRALVAAPRLLLLDEPSLGLAPIVVRAVFSALREVSARTPVLLVEQNTSQALRISTRAAALVAGKIVLSGSAHEMSDRSALLDSYLGQAKVRQTEGSDAG
jgi:branched-chain amino acid transport system ATP-binding protein